MNSQNEDNNLYVNAGNVIGIIADLKRLIDEIDSNSKKAKDLILELAQRLDAERPTERMNVYIRIRDILKDKITEGKIIKWIEECLPQEYKRIYTKSQVSSLSKKAKRNVAVQQRKNKHIITARAQSTKSVLTTIGGDNDNGNYDDSNLYNDDEIKQGPNKEITNQILDDSIFCYSHLRSYILTDSKLCMKIDKEIDSSGRKLRCQRCFHEWEYGGKNPYFTLCPHCRTTVRVRRKNKIESLQSAQVGS